MGNALKDFSVGKMRKTELYEVVYDFSVDYDSIDVDDIHEYLMKKHDTK